MDVVFDRDIHFLFLNFATIHIFIPKCTEEGGATGLGNIPKKKVRPSLI